MIYIDLDADLNMEDDDGRNVARNTPPAAAAPAVGDVLVAGRPDFWSWVVVDDVDGDIVYFHQARARHAAELGNLVVDVPRAI